MVSRRFQDMAFTRCQLDALEEGRRDCDMEFADVQDHEMAMLRSVRDAEERRHKEYRQTRLDAGYDTPEGELDLVSWLQMPESMQESAIASFRYLAKPKADTNGTWSPNAGSW